MIKAVVLSIIMFISATPAMATENIDSDVVIILDTSGSMEQTFYSRTATNVKLEYAKEKLGEMLTKLASQNKHTVRLITFAGGQAVLTEEVNLLDNTSLPAMIQKVDSLKANGGTPLANSILFAKDLFLSRTAKERSLIILSDGQDDRGSQVVVDAIRTFNKEVKAGVSINMFALGISPALWAEFKDLGKIIVMGTLYLIDGSEGSGSYFDLTYDSIAGNWSSAKFRSELENRTRLGAIHAEHIQIVSALSRASKVDEQRLVTIDWNQLKNEDPELYEKMKAWFESIEIEYMRSRTLLTTSYLVNELSKEKRDGKITPAAVYKKALIDNFLAIKNDDKATRSDKSMGYTSVGLYSALASPAAIINTIASFTFNNNEYRRTFSLSSIDNNLTFLEVAIFVGGLAGHSMLFGSDDFGRSNKVASVVGLLGATYSWSNFSAAAPAMNAHGDLTRSRDFERKKYSSYLKTENARRTLKVLMPNLSDSEIALRLNKVEAEQNHLVRMQILFEGNIEIQNRINAATAVSEVIETYASKVDAQKALRKTDDLPTDVEAYLTQLTRDLRDLSSSGAYDSLASKADAFIKAAK